MSDSNLTVEGFKFNSTTDAEAAREELKRIAYIEEHINYENPENVLTIYKKVISNRIFVTPIGYDYLKKIQKFLKDSPDIDDADICPLPLNNVYVLEKEMKEAPKPKPKIIPAKKRNKEQDRLFISLAVNAALVVLLVATFIMAMTSDNPNVINYKTNLENRYSQWEAELQEREKTVREKEQELNIAKE
ncbi:MAG: hypothetical protein K6F39_03595 [Lachnospiraceae bacterium]|nr:hypothetical protein [Lachnospiraceae bacterium]